MIVFVPATCGVHFDQDAAVETAAGKAFLPSPPGIFPSISVHVDLDVVGCRLARKSRTRASIESVTTFATSAMSNRFICLAHGLVNLAAGGAAAKVKGVETAHPALVAQRDTQGCHILSVAVQPDALSVRRQ